MKGFSYFAPTEIVYGRGKAEGASAVFTERRGGKGRSASWRGGPCTGQASMQRGGMIRRDPWADQMLPGYITALASTDRRKEERVPTGCSGDRRAAEKVHRYEGRP